MQVAPEGPAPGPVTDPGRLLTELRTEFTRLSEGAATDPFRNPVLMLAHHVSRRLARGEVSLPVLESALQTLSVQGFLARSRRLSRYLGESDPRRNTDTLRRLARKLATNADGETVSFEDYKARIEREWFGAVITAHPTFNLSGEMMHALIDLAINRGPEGGPLDDEAREERLAIARKSEHKPEPMTLDREHEFSYEVIVNLHKALRRAHTAALEVAEELYPERWRELTPRLMTVASWVGYDLDGRSDIGWTDTLQMHLRGHAHRLRLMLEEIASIRASAQHQEKKNAEALVGALDRITTRLRATMDEVTDEIAAFGRTEADPAEVRARIGKISRRIVEGLPHRLTDSQSLIEVLQGALDVASSSAMARRLLVLRAELANTGLGLSHVHVRINASQLHNAIRGAVSMEGQPDDPRYRASYMARIDELLGKVETAKINFGSIMSERASARRLFMVTAQMLKYVDNKTPVRFLIAECETAFTVLSALYLSLILGVDNRIDISPLFETEKALENGHRIIEQLLKVPAYRAYVQKRGRLCIQTGYSDAGRYLGQMSAAAAIERFKLSLAKVLKNQGMAGVELVMFDTHGESVGRGAHPANLTEALAYVDTPASRDALTRAGIQLKEEVSFQGGDGYLYFLNPTAALAALTRVLEHVVEPPAMTADPFYVDSDGVRELFTGITQFQVEMMDSTDFGALLGAFATNFTYSSGSRNAVRQREENEVKTVTHAAELRAIPQNAALQQLGVLANSASGLGQPIRRDPQRFAALYRDSARLRTLMGIAEYAMSVGSFDALEAYIETQNPRLWLARAGAASEGAWTDRMSKVAAMLEQADLHDAQVRIVRKLYTDHLMGREALQEVAREYGGTLPGSKLVETETHSSLSILHALRVALILQLYELTTRVPDFAPQLGTTRERVVLRLLHLDVPGAVDTLERIFSLQPSAQIEDFGEQANYRGDDQHTYEAEHAEVFRPLREIHSLVRRVSSAVIHHIGFFG